jgi:hypothetical protein
VDIRPVNGIFNLAGTIRGAAGKTAMGNGAGLGLTPPAVQADVVSLGNGGAGDAKLYSASPFFKMTGSVQLASDEFGASGLVSVLA